jgi:hypothetical protein
MRVCLAICLHVTPWEWIFMKFDIDEFYQTLSTHHFWLKSVNNDIHFMWWPLCISVHLECDLWVTKYMRGVWKVMRLLTLSRIWGFLKLWYDIVSKLMSTYFLNMFSRPFCDILCSVVAVGYITSLSEPSLCLISSCVSISNTQKS